MLTVAVNDVNSKNINNQRIVIQEKDCNLKLAHL